MKVRKVCCLLVWWCESQHWWWLLQVSDDGVKWQHYHKDCSLLSEMIHRMDCRFWLLEACWAYYWCGIHQIPHLDILCRRSQHNCLRTLRSIFCCSIRCHWKLSCHFYVSLENHQHPHLQKLQLFTKILSQTPGGTALDGRDVGVEELLAPAD